MNLDKVFGVTRWVSVRAMWLLAGAATLGGKAELLPLAIGCLAVYIVSAVYFSDKKDGM